MTDEPKTETEKPAVTTETPAPAAAPVVEAAAPVASSPEASPAEPAKTEADAEYKETLLEAVTKELAAETEPKVEEAKAGETEKKPEGEPQKTAEPEKPALEPIEYKYEVPEGFEIDDARKGELSKALDEFRANPAEGAKGLLDLHAKAVVEAVNKARADQMQVFNNTKADWEKLILAHPTVGGPGFETAKRAVARVRDAALAGMDASRKADFEHFLRVTGAGSHPAFWDMLHELAAYVDEPTQSPTGILPPRDTGKAPRGARRNEGFYEHPRGGLDA